MDHLNQIKVFVTVVDRQSFTGAAKALGMAKSTVSRQISDLEGRLGVRLLYRTTRVLHPTEVGHSYVERCRSILEDVAEADTSVKEESGDALSGTLRITAAALFATQHLIQPISTFQQLHPGVKIDLRVDDAYVNLVENGLDLAIRVITTPPDSSLVARKLTHTTHHVVASPDFLARHSVNTLDELRTVPALIRQPPGRTWTLTDKQQNTRKLNVSPILTCNQGEPLLRAALTGMGVGLFPDFMTYAYIRSGQLVRVLPTYAGTTSGVFAIYPHRRLLSSRVRGFIDHVAEAWSTPPWLRRSVI